MKTSIAKSSICFISLVVFFIPCAESQLLSATDESAEVNIYCSGETVDVYSYYEKRDSDRYYCFRFVNRELTSVFFGEETEYQILEADGALMKFFHIPADSMYDSGMINGFNIVDRSLRIPGPSKNYKEGWVEVVTGTYEMNFTIFFNDFSGDLLSISQRIPTEEGFYAETAEGGMYDPHGLNLVFRKKRQLSILRTYYQEKQSGVEIYVDRKGRISLMNIWSGNIIYQRLTKRTLRKLLKFGCD